MAATRPALIPQLQSLHDQLVQIKREVEEITTGLSDSQLDWSPDRNTWSISQILEHLDKVGELIVDPLRKGIEELKTRGLRGEGPFRYSFIERLFIRMLSPNPPFRSPVPPQYVPAAAGAVKDPLPRFLKLQDEFRALLQEASGLNLTALKVVSPASRVVRLSVGAWLEAMVAHERYHLLQIHALRKRPDFPSS
jgi:hypothetical protein